MPGIRSLDIGLLTPRTIPLNEDINRTGTVEPVIVLISVDALGGAAFVRSADSQCAAVAAESDGMSFERASITEVIAHLCVGSFDVGDLLELRS